MLTEYIRSAMRVAKYEILSDGTFYGEIPGFQGVYANEETLDACREQLQEVLEGWIILGLRLGHTLPIINGIELAIHQAVIESNQAPKAQHPGEMEFHESGANFLAITPKSEAMPAAKEKGGVIRHSSLSQNQCLNTRLSRTKRSPNHARQSINLQSL